jgi:hypothetical protein
LGTPAQELFEERADVRPLRPDAARRIDRAELVGDVLGGQVERCGEAVGEGSRGAPNIGSFEWHPSPSDTLPADHDFLEA